MGNSLLGASSAVATVTLFIQHVNQAPVLVAPAVLSVLESGAVATSALLASPSPLTVADVDAGGGSLTVTLSAAQPALALSGSGASALSAFLLPPGPAPPSATLTAAGNLTQINALLAAVAYAPPPLFVGADAISISVSDNGRCSMHARAGDGAATHAVGRCRVWGAYTHVLGE